jgi:ribonuclease J
LLIEDGQSITCDADGARLSERVATGRVLLDRSGAEGVAEEIVKDRRHLSFNGIVVPVIVIEKQTGRPCSSPEVVSRGLADAGPDLADDAGRRVLETLEALTPEERQDVALTRERVRLDLLRFYKKRTARRPLVVPVVMEI